MISVRLPDEIKKFEETVWSVFTWRKLIFSILGISVGLAIFLLGKDSINEDLLGWLEIIVVMGFGAMGWFKKNGMHFEQYAKTMILYFFKPTIYKYRPVSQKEELIMWECDELRKQLEISSKKGAKK